MLAWVGARADAVLVVIVRLVWLLARRDALGFDADLGRCPSGQRERAVNPSASPTEVRILPGPPPSAAWQFRPATSRSPRAHPVVLTPAFGPGVNEYSVSVTHDVGQITLKGSDILTEIPPSWWTDNPSYNTPAPGTSTEGWYDRRWPSNPSTPWRRAHCLIRRQRSPLPSGCWETRPRVRCSRFSGRRCSPRRWGRGCR